MSSSLTWWRKSLSLAVSLVACANLLHAQDGASGGIPEGKFAVFSSFPVELYGYLKADAIYNDSQVAINELTMNAPLETMGDNDKYSLTAKESRLGANVTGPELPNGGKIMGKVEADFFGDAADATTTSGLRIRQAYVNLRYATWDLLAGQAWDFFSPLNPGTLNFAVLWRAGNIGDRHPQIRLTKRFKQANGGMFGAEVGAIDPKTAQQTNRGYPLGAGRVSYEKPYGGDKSAAVGLGGLIGSSDISTTNSNNVHVWAGSVDFKWKACAFFTLMGEGYAQQGLGAALRAANGAFTSAANEAVSSRGGWMQVSSDLTKKVQLNVGGGVDNVKDRYVTAATIWNWNHSIFANTKIKVAKNVTWGLEYQFFKTEFAGNTDGDNNRFHSALILNY
jgi:hypothetical protein